MSWHFPRLLILQQKRRIWSTYSLKCPNLFIYLNYFLWTGIYSFPVPSNFCVFLESFSKFIDCFLVENHYNILNSLVSVLRAVFFCWFFFNRYTICIFMFCYFIFFKNISVLWNVSIKKWKKKKVIYCRNKPNVSSLLSVSLSVTVRAANAARILNTI